MSKRSWLLLTTILAQAGWIATLRHSGLEPRDAPVLRGVLVYGPSLLISGVGLLVALRTGLFTRSEVGLEAPGWASRTGRLGWPLLLLGIFLASALVDMAGPIGTMLSNGMSYKEIVDHLRSYEYRYVFGRIQPPPDAWDIGVQATKRIVLAPLSEEIPYRALFVPVLLSRLSRGWTAVASGVVFLLLHWLAYNGQLHPAHFLSGWAFAWAFMVAGLPGALAAHAGVNFGVVVLGTFAGLSQG
ncbi:CPBP family intramembrane glutamic endopeptidase [Nannocystis radixulma]|uniref:CPBP family intramembrane metalloprotease n=1 Tax=Nannocystis radixulma TaxID=2995305 RepID=A0ABT5BHF9_9BACT|nr:CPBP family intramembrane glutamic endopeptidase [Nannocystis radixulma]MDC0672472.1 CPBP family intramembrane metalloprotease [Nannocystis radixulma]